MKLDLNKPILVKPSNLPLIQDDKIVTIREVLEKSLRYVVRVSNNVEHNFYKKLMNTVIDEELSSNFEITLEEALLIQQWIYVGNLPAFISGYMIDYLNGAE